MIGRGEGGGGEVEKGGGGAGLLIHWRNLQPQWGHSSRQGDEKAGWTTRRQGRREGWEQEKNSEESLKSNVSRGTTTLGQTGRHGDILYIYLYISLFLYLYIRYSLSFILRSSPKRPLATCDLRPALLACFSSLSARARIPARPRQQGRPSAHILPNFPNRAPRAAVFPPH